MKFSSIGFDWVRFTMPGLIRLSVPFQYCRFFGQDILDLSVSSCGSGDVSYLLALQRNNMNLHSLSIRRFWGKGERWKRKRERAEGEKRLTQMLLLEPSTPTQRDSIPSNQNHFRSLDCQLHVSKSSPKIKNSLRSGRAPVLVLL